VNDLSDIELPKLAISITDSENTEPTLAKPTTDMDEPKRAKVLNESVEPTFTQSNTDIAAPRRV
jgi:hypothetical protein